MPKSFAGKRRSINLRLLGEQWNAPWHHAYLRWYDRVGPQLAAGVWARPWLQSVIRGLASAAAGTRYLEGLLFGLTPLDPSTFIAVTLLFALVATIASSIPAYRATQVDPVIALRHE